MCHPYIERPHSLIQVHVNGHQHQSHNPCLHMRVRGNNFIIDDLAPLYSIELEVISSST